jgi:excisionase family DNA binding protein
LLSSEEAAAYLDIAVVTLRRMCKRRAIAFIRVSPREFHFDPTDLDEFKASRRHRRKTAC